MTVQINLWWGLWVVVGLAFLVFSIWKAHTEDCGWGFGWSHLGCLACTVWGLVTLAFTLGRACR